MKIKIIKVSDLDAGSIYIVKQMIGVDGDIYEMSDDDSFGTVEYTGVSADNTMQLMTCDTDMVMKNMFWLKKCKVHVVDVITADYREKILDIYER